MEVLGTVYFPPNKSTQCMRSTNRATLMNVLHLSISPISFPTEICAGLSRPALSTPRAPWRTELARWALGANPARIQGCLSSAWRLFKLRGV